jgi:uncharacterized membrane protein YcaP (DUF421 family)
MTTFDFVLLLIVSESVQQGLVAENRSITAAILVVMTLVMIDLVLSFAKQKWHGLERVMDGVPVLLVEHGRALTEPMRKERIDEDDILEAARKTRGLEKLEQIRYAVLERNGGISIVPEEKRGHG